MNSEDSREGAKARRNIEELSALVVENAYRLHVEAGPGLLESVYEVVLARMLEVEGLAVLRQVPVPIRLMGLNFDEGFRMDLLVLLCYRIALLSPSPCNVFGTLAVA